MVTTQNTAARREPVSQAAQARQLRPVSGRNEFAGREPQVDRLAVLSSMLQRDPRANANRGNSELCMQDFL